MLNMSHNIELYLYVHTLYYFSITRSLVLIAKDELSQRGHSADDKKGVLEKLLEVDEKIALIMAGDLLFTGVDTVKLINYARQVSLLCLRTLQYWLYKVIYTFCLRQSLETFFI